MLERDNILLERVKKQSDEKAFEYIFHAYYNSLCEYVHGILKNQSEAEDIVSGTRTVTGTAFVTFVVLDQNGKPTPAPKLLLKTDEDKKKFEAGKLRMKERLKQRTQSRS